MTSPKQSEDPQIVVLRASFPVDPSPQPEDSWVAPDEPHDAHSEVARLRELIGPDDLSYTALKLELWAVRDLLIGMEAELGNAHGRCQMLERDIEVTKRELLKTQERLDERTGSKPADYIRGKARSLRDRGV